MIFAQKSIERWTQGTGVGYYHEKTNRVVQFDGPHPGNELYRYQIKKIINFLEEVGELC